MPSDLCCIIQHCIIYLTTLFKTGLTPTYKHVSHSFLTAIQTTQAHIHLSIFLTVFLAPHGGPHGGYGGYPNYHKERCRLPPGQVACRSWGYFWICLFVRVLTTSFHTHEHCSLLMGILCYMSQQA